ncbi:ALF repeat-containing protein [Amycolatopsis circi]|uniref:ALF repeat-containing protein n=1 Tax=Amycolatopsis circi TaxID=871959 RepID=UPI003CC68DF5
MGPLLLIGWSEVGPGLLQALVGVRGAVRPDDRVRVVQVLSAGGPEAKQAASQALDDGSPEALRDFPTPVSSLRANATRNCFRLPIWRR